MDCKYESLRHSQEKLRTTSFDSSSTLDDLNDLELSFKSDADIPYSKSPSRVHQFVASKWAWLAHAVLLLSSCSLFVLSLNVRSSILKHVREFSAWCEFSYDYENNASQTDGSEPTAPADTAVEYTTQTYNITTKENRFVGAGPEVDKAWREISYDSKPMRPPNRTFPLLCPAEADMILTVGDQWISKADIHKLGMPDTSLKVDNPQTGEEGYRVGIEVFHQLHCINLLRRVTYKDYYEPLGGEFGKGPEALQKHTGMSLLVFSESHFPC